MHWTDRVGRRVKLRDLHILLAVAESGSMVKAADRLAVSQPVVSKTISDLELALGQRLLDRTSRGVAPTIYGEALLKCGTAVFDEMRQGIRQVEFLANPTVGQLRLGCQEAMAAGFVPGVAERFSRQFPGVVLEVVNADMTHKFRELRERTVELLIGRIQTPLADEELLAEPLFEERLFVAAGTRSRWARRQRINLAELIDERWVLPPFDTEPGILGKEIFRVSGLNIPVANTITFSINFACSLLATGRFVAFLPGSLLRFSAERLSLKVLPVKLPPHQSVVGVVTVKNRTLSPLADRFIVVARAVAKQLAEFGLARVKPTA
jgi:DNA-binding transcriptional LysR family regulator